MNDVKHQDHYEKQGIQPITLMASNLTVDEFKGFLRGNVIKYVLRAPLKNGIEDYKKALTYLTWLIEFSETGKITV
jgi:hypothetical protein